MANSKKNQEKVKKFATRGQEFTRAQIEAGKSTSQKFGRKFQKNRLAQLGAVSGRRRDGVLFKVTSRGSLVMLDLAPLASAQEYGRVITPTSGDYLRVAMNGNKVVAGSTFTVKGKDGEIYLMSGEGKSAQVTGVLKRKVVIKRNAPSGRFATILNAGLKNYKDELAQQLIAKLTK